MKLKNKPIAALTALWIIGTAVTGVSAASVESPSGKLTLNVDVDAQGQPYYTLLYKGKPIVAESKLGLKSDETDYATGFRIARTGTTSVDRIWKPVWGEYDSIRDNFNELQMDLVSDSPARALTLRFRLFDDGLGFRYEFPESTEGKNYLTVRDELTEFNFNGDHTLFCIPGDYDTDEYLWSETPFSRLEETLSGYGKHSEACRTGGNVIQTPLMMKTADPVYVNIHEAALSGYPAILLDVEPETHKMRTHLVPDRLGVKAYLQLPFNTPWRTLIVSDDARDILASQLILNLNEPCKIEDTSWIKPMNRNCLFFRKAAQSSQPSFQPSTSTPSMPCLDAKSI